MHSFFAGIKTVKYAAHSAATVSPPFKFIWYWTPLRHIQEQDQYWMRPMPYHHIKSISALKISFAWSSTAASFRRDISTYFRKWNFFFLSFLFDWQQLVLVRWFTSNFSKEKKRKRSSLFNLLSSFTFFFVCVVHNNYIKPTFLKRDTISKWKLKRTPF